MSKKRIVAREWKRKRNQQRSVHRLVLTAVCIALVAGIGFIGWDMWSRTFVMTFEGQRVPTADMRFFSFFALFNESPLSPQEQALESLINFYLIEQAAQRHNLALTEEEQIMADEQAVEIMEMFEMFGMPRPNISYERASQFLATDFLSEQLVYLYTDDFVVDEDHLEESFQEFMMFNRSDFVNMDFLFFHGFDYDEAIALEPEDFDEQMIISLADLREDPDFDIWDLNYLSSLEVGEISEPFPLDDGTFLTLLVDYFDIMPDDEIKEIFRESYEFVERMQVFSAIIEEWREAADIQINQRGVNAA